jgi:opacity protein-like surface antigen
MNPHKILPIVTVFLLVNADAALAQSSIGGRGYVTYGTTAFGAGDSFEAVTGTSTKSGLGGGGTITGLWRGVFVDVAVSQQKLKGERVFMDAETVYRLGIPLTVRLRPIDVAAGWRFTVAGGRVSPFAGVGASVVSYKETSSFAQSGDDISEQKTGALVLGGVDVAVWKWIHVGGDVRYRAVTGVLGLDGVSEVFNEDQLGGFSGGVRVSVGR